MRRILPLLMLFMLLLSACVPGSTEDDGPIAGLDTTAVPSAQPNGGATPTPASGATITFAAWESETPVYERLAATFREQNPDINVVIVPMEDLTTMTDPNAPQDPVTQLRRLVSGADTLPMNYIAPETLGANLLLDLKPLMDGDSSFNRDDFYAGVLERGTYPQGTLLLPRYVYTQILYYNKDLFKKAELPAPKADWTWSDLLAASEQIANSGGENYGFFDYSGGFLALLNEIENRKLKVLDTPPADVDLTTPEIEQVVTKVQGMFDNRTLLSGNFKEGALDPQQITRDGRVGLFPAELASDGGPRPIDSSGNSPVPTSGPEPLPFEVGKVAYPRTTSALGNNSSVEGYSISAGTRFPNQAWRWIEFLSRQRLESDGAAGSPSFAPGRIPARQSLAKEIGYWDALDAETKTAYEAALAQQAPQLTTTPDYTVISALNQAMYDVTGNGTKPAQALRTAQDSLKEQLAQIAQLTPTPKPEVGGPVVVATPVPQVAPAGATTISFDVTGFQTALFRRIAQQFNSQNNGYFVQIKATQQLTQPLTLAQTAKTVDCFTSYTSPQSSNDFAALLDMRPLFEADASFKLDDYPPAVLGQFSNNGGIYGLPYSFNLRNLTYNKTLFDAAGQAAPTGAWKPEDFLAAAKVLTSGTGDKKVYGYVPNGGSVGDMIFFINQFGGQLSTGSGPDAKPNFSDPKVVQAIQWYIDLAKVQGVMPELYIPYKADDQYNDPSYDLVMNGRAGMWLDYSYGSFDGGMKGPDGQDLKWEPGYAPLPVGAAGLQTGDLYARGFYISNTSQQQQGCWEWLKFLSKDTSNLNGDLPARISVATSAEFKQVANPNQIKAYEMYKDVLQKPSTINNGLNALYNASPFGVDTYWFFKAIDETIQKDANLEEGLKKADELTKAHMACVAETKKPATCAKQVDPGYNGYTTQDPDPNQPIVMGRG